MVNAGFHQWRGGWRWRLPPKKKCFSKTSAGWRYLSQQFSTLSQHFTEKKRVQDTVGESGKPTASGWPTAEPQRFRRKTPSRQGQKIHRCVSRTEKFLEKLLGGFLKWWYPTTIFPTKNDHFGVFWGYHHFRKPPFDACESFPTFCFSLTYVTYLDEFQIVHQPPNCWCSRLFMEGFPYYTSHAGEGLFSTKFTLSYKSWNLTFAKKKAQCVYFFGMPPG